MAPPKKCTSSQVRNPATGRCVLRSGKLGKLIASAGHGMNEMERLALTATSRKAYRKPARPRETPRKPRETSRKASRPRETPRKPRETSRKPRVPVEPRDELLAEIAELKKLFAADMREVEHARESKAKKAGAVSRTTKVLLVMAASLAAAGVGYYGWAPFAAQVPALMTKIQELRKTATPAARAQLTKAMEMLKKLPNKASEWTRFGSVREALSSYGSAAATYAMPVWTALGTAHAYAIKPAHNAIKAWWTPPAKSWVNAARNITTARAAEARAAAGKQLMLYGTTTPWAEAGLYKRAAGAAGAAAVGTQLVPYVPTTGLAGLAGLSKRVLRLGGKKLQNKAPYPFMRTVVRTDL